MEKEIREEKNKTETNKEFIQDQIESFLELFKYAKGNIGIYKDQIKEFLRLIVAQGHLNKLDENYKRKFAEINNRYKEEFKPAKPKVVYDDF
ncbi:MAG: hypothetical protein ACFE8A_14095 [Candidatus Hodarchaeota archaeon]